MILHHVYCRTWGRTRMKIGFVLIPIRIRIGINMQIRIRVQIGIVGGQYSTVEQWTDLRCSSCIETVGGHDAGRCKVGSTLEQWTDLRCTSCRETVGGHDAGLYKAGSTLQ